MPYLGSVVVVVLALLALGLLAWRLAAPARRLTLVRTRAAADIGDKVRMLKARLAALRVRLAERRA